MATVARISWPRILRAAVLAGIAGGILFDLAIVGFQTLAGQHPSLPALWQFVASTMFGRVAFTSPAYVWVGLVMHFAVSIAWAGGFAYLAQTKPVVIERPVISGFFFGLVVYVVMQLVLYSVQALRISGAPQVVAGLIEHTVFFGIPVAVVTRAQNDR